VQKNTHHLFFFPFAQALGDGSDASANQAIDDADDTALVCAEP